MNNRYTDRNEHSDWKNHTQKQPSQTDHRLPEWIDNLRRYFRFYDYRPPYRQ